MVVSVTRGREGNPLATGRTRRARTHLIRLRCQQPMNSSPARGPTCSRRRRSKPIWSAPGAHRPELGESGVHVPSRWVLLPEEHPRGRSIPARTHPRASYSLVGADYEVDFFGDSLTFIRKEEFRGESTTYDKISGSGADVRAKAAEADGFLAPRPCRSGRPSRRRSRVRGLLVPIPAC